MDNFYLKIKSYFDDFWSNIIFNFLKIRTIFYNKLNGMKQSITTVDNIKGIKENEEIDLFYRFLTITFLNYLSNKIKALIEKIDVQVDKLKITESNQTISNKNMIIQGNSDKKMTIQDSIEKINNIPKDIKADVDLIFLKVEIKSKVNDDNYKSFCIKDYLFQYEDFNNSFDNTLENIFEFQKIDIPDNSVIDISYFKNKAVHSYRINYSDYKNKHINELYNL